MNDLGFGDGFHPKDFLTSGIRVVMLNHWECFNFGLYRSICVLEFIDTNFGIAKFKNNFGLFFWLVWYNPGLYSHVVGYYVN